jgi:uncharacterized protein (TIGR02001 family)
MKTHPFAFLLLAFAGAPAVAQTPPAGGLALSANAGLVSDYRYRGISQSRLRPALQAGADLAHPSGLYAGVWSSSVRWIRDAGGDGGAEVDVYGGYKFSAGPLGLDAGVLRYLYPRSRLALSPDTTELYAAATWGPATLKYSHATTNLFGFADSKGSHYLELGASFDTGVWGLAVVPHVGYQRVRNNAASSYADWSVALVKDFGNGLSASLTYVDTDTRAYTAPNGRNLGRAGTLAGVKYTHAF